MIACSAASLIPSVDQLVAFAAVAGSIVTAASAVCAMTPTPAPGTRLARLYRCLEIAALLVGHAKETGILPATRLDRALGDTRSGTAGSP